MIKKISALTVVVKDQDEALEWYTKKLGFEKRMDLSTGPGFRWLTVAPSGQTGTEITLALWKWYGTRSEEQIGKNTTIVLETSSAKEDYTTMEAKGVKFSKPLREEAFGFTADFVDLYGNPYSLVERKASSFSK